MRGEKVAEEILERAGLVVPRQHGGGFYDRFRGRLLFAIRDLQGRVVAFGGRALGDESPKYLNSPETPLYSKGQMLYGMDLARDSIRTRNRALLVEGYLDCVTAHQYGFAETVAALGTAFTPAQLALLRRYCREVVTFFDADLAGQKAAERAEELLEPSPDGMRWALSRNGSFGDAESVRPCSRPATTLTPCSARRAPPRSPSASRRRGASSPTRSTARSPRPATRAGRAGARPRSRASR